MDRSKLNLIIDGLLMLCTSALVGIGFLMKCVLPPGPDRRAKFGGNVGIYWPGTMDRHDWGRIHLIIALVVVGLLALHIVLHWKQIVALTRRFIAGRGTRWALGLTFAAVSALLLAFPFFAKPAVVDSRNGEGSGRLEETRGWGQEEASAEPRGGAPGEAKERSRAVVSPPGTSEGRGAREHRPAADRARRHGRGVRGE
jgi:hypothetical protein